MSAEQELRLEHVKLGVSNRFHRVFPSCDDRVVAIIFDVPSLPHLYHLHFSDHRYGVRPH